MVDLFTYPLKDKYTALKYSVRVHNAGTLYDVLVALAKVTHDDEKRSSGDAMNTNNLKGDGQNQKDDEKKETLEKEYADRAKNFAVVDMKDGYIFRIASVSYAFNTVKHMLGLLSHHATRTTSEFMASA